MPAVAGARTRSRMCRLPPPQSLPPRDGEKFRSLLQPLVLACVHYGVNRTPHRTLQQGTNERDAIQCPPYRLPSRPKSPHKLRNQHRCQARSAPRPTSSHPPRPVPISCLRPVPSSPRPIPPRTFHSSRPPARQACRRQSPDRADPNRCPNGSGRQGALFRHRPRRSCITTELSEHMCRIRDFYVHNGPHGWNTDGGLQQRNRWNELPGFVDQAQGDHANATIESPHQGFRRSPHPAKHSRAHTRTSAISAPDAA